MALLAGHVWTRPVPMAVRFGPGVALVTVAALLAFAARGTHCRPVGRAGVAGCAGTVALDEDDVTPAAVMLADPFPGAAEAGPAVRCRARLARKLNAELADAMAPPSDD